MRQVTTARDHVAMRLPASFRKSVVFLYAEFKNPSTGLDESRPLGTGVVISWPVGDGSSSVLYIATANHLLYKVAADAATKKIFIRINKKGGGSHVYPSDLDSWRAHPDEGRVDVAVLQLDPTDYPNWDWSHVPKGKLATQRVLEDEFVGPGDPVQAVGLYSRHVGPDRNEPIVRTGHIAALPADPIQVVSYGEGEVVGSLVEIPSIGGLSGAPVYVNLTGARQDDEGNLSVLAAQIYLFGLVHGHWETNDPSFPNSVHEGIAVVTPAAQIIETIEA